MWILAFLFLCMAFWGWRRLWQLVAESTILGNGNLVRFLMKSKRSGYGSDKTLAIGRAFGFLGGLIVGIGVVSGIVGVRMLMLHWQYSTWIFITFSVISALGILAGRSMNLEWWQKFREYSPELTEVGALKIFTNGIMLMMSFGFCVVSFIACYFAIK